MTAFASWFSPAVMRPLAWALVHFLWEGLALAALLSVMLTVSRRANARYALALATLILMLVAPVATFVYLWQPPSYSRSAATAAAPAPDTSYQRLAPVAATAGAPVAPAQPAPPSAPPSGALLWLVEAWFAGVIFFSLRTAGGVLLIDRLRRKEATPLSAMLHARCIALQRRLGIKRAIRYCESIVLQAPAVIGWFRPVVLLPVTALTGLSPEQLEAVVAHELAHIRRLDCFVNLFQIAAETLLFYHPAVWWVSKRLRAERENCCDDVAITVCGDVVEYARALTLMEEWRAAPALAMAANRGPLATRVARLLGLANFGGGIRSAGFAVSFLCLAGALCAGNAFLGVAHTSLTAMHPQLTGDVNNSLTAESAPQVQARLLSRAITTEMVHKLLVAPVVRNTAVEIRNVAVHIASSDPQPQDAKNDEHPRESYIDGLKSVGLDHLTIDEIVSMKVQGITPEYVRAIHDLGLKPSPDDLIGMKVQGVTPEYIRDMRAAGFNPDADQLIGMKTQGITPEYIKQMKDLGIKLDADELVGMKVQGITPEYIREMRASGFNPGADQLMGMKVQGITPDYIKQMKDLGIKPDADELIGMKVQGVTPEYIRDMRAAGFNPDADQLIGMKAQGVTPAYIKEMKALGLQFDADDVIGMRVQGVSPEYVREIRATGINPGADDLVSMRVQGVTPEYIKTMQNAGLGKLDTDDLVSAKVQGITPEFIEKVRQHGFHDLTLEKLLAIKRAGIF